MTYVNQDTAGKRSSTNKGWRVGYGSDKLYCPINVFLVSPLAISNINYKSCRAKTKTNPDVGPLTHKPLYCLIEDYSICSINQLSNKYSVAEITATCKTLDHFRFRSFGDCCQCLYMIQKQYFTYIICSRNLKWGKAVKYVNRSYEIKNGLKFRK
jgi:hypothetical protein